MLHYRIVRRWGTCVPQFLSRDTYMTNAMTFSPATGRSLVPGHGLTPLVPSPFSACTGRPWPGQWCCTMHVLAQITDSHLTSFRKEKYSEQRTTPLSHLILVPAPQWYRHCFAEPKLSNSLHWIWVQLYSVSVQHFPQVTQRLDKKNHLLFPVLAALERWISYRMDDP